MYLIMKCGKIDIKGDFQPSRLPWLHPNHRDISLTTYIHLGISLTTGNICLRPGIISVNKI